MSARPKTVIQKALCGYDSRPYNDMFPGSGKVFRQAADYQEKAEVVLEALAAAGYANESVRRIEKAFHVSCRDGSFDGCPVVVEMTHNFTQDILICNKEMPCSDHGEIAELGVLLNRAEGHRR